MFKENGGVNFGFNPEQKESLEDQTAELINNTSTIIELKELLSSIGGIQGSKKFYSSEELIEIIERVENNTGNIDEITRTCGLRSKVEELLNGDDRE